MLKNDAEAQLTGSYVDYINQLRIEDHNNTKNILDKQLTVELDQQKKNLLDALQEISKLRAFIEHPEHILGNELTKHGEIAEHVEVAIVNAKEMLKGLQARAIIDSDIVGRTAPEDYIIDGVKVQSKFINGDLNSLKHVYEHLLKYKDIGFARSDGSYYHIPRDQFENIKSILDGGDIDGRSLRAKEAIFKMVKEIEAETSRDFSEVVRPAHINYSDAQRGNVERTIDRVEHDIKQTNENIKQEYKIKHDEKIKAAEAEHKPNLGEAGKAAVAGAAVSAALTLALKIYAKKKAGKQLKDFTAEDWQDIGLETAKGTLKGGVSGFAIYGLTNYAAMPAPLAGGLISAAYGIMVVLDSYRKGEISFSEFVQNGKIVCLNTAMSIIGSLAGQALIPIPVVGPLVGIVATNILLDSGRGIYTQEEQRLLEDYRKQITSEKAALDIKLQEFIDELMKQYQALGGIIKMAFDQSLNIQLRFQYSMLLAAQCGVAEGETLHSRKDIEVYFKK